MSDVDPISNAYCKPHGVYCCTDCWPIRSKHTLTELAQKWCADKFYSHSYIPVYEKLFKGRSVRRLLEIGIGYEDLMKPFVPKYIHGASLKMWEEFLPDAEIFACDIREDTLINKGRIHSMVCDQSKGHSLADMIFEFTDGLSKMFDVVIDDGSHQTDDQILTATCLFPRLSPHGLYVIEDVREPDVIVEKLRHMRPVVLKFDKRPDDCLVVIQK